MPRVVWASSTTILGPVATYPAGEVDEGAPAAPSSVYGVSKLACEELARVLADDLGIETVGLRLPLVYGPGRWYGGSQEGLVRFVADLLAGRTARIQAWTESADWIHVADAADALLAAVNAAEPSRLYQEVVVEIDRVTPAELGGCGQVLSEVVTDGGEIGLGGPQPCEAGELLLGEPVRQEVADDRGHVALGVADQLGFEADLPQAVLGADRTARANCYAERWVRTA